MKNKLINFRITHEFDAVLEYAWQSKKYLSKGIRSKSDLFRYAIIQVLETENKGFIKQFNKMKEIQNFMAWKDIGLDPTRAEPRILRKVKRFFNYKLKNL